MGREGVYGHFFSSSRGVDASCDCIALCAGATWRATVALELESFALQRYEKEKAKKELSVCEPLHIRR
jgi:hypothetical protein